MALAATWLPTRGPGGLTRWPLPAALTACLVLAVALAPWAIRNWRALDSFVPLTTNAGITLYDGLNVDNATGGSDQSFVGRMPQLSLMNEAERSTYLRGKAFDYVRAHPGDALRLTGQKLLRTWSPVPLSEGTSRLQRLAGLAFAVPIFLLALLGATSGRIDWRSKLLLLTPVLVLTAVHAASVGSLRYRLPVEPVLAVLASAGVAAVLRNDPPAAEVVRSEAEV